MNLEEIIKVQRNVNGDIINFQTSSGRIISYRKAALEVEEGLITGIDIREDDEGYTHLTNTLSDDENFSSYPTIF
ncbi:DUF3892 domain-containing protein [Rossellomorea sp. BNER]|nr:DUF3892 domain-containing protein [Rossellomorea sp. BNER]